MVWARFDDNWADDACIKSLSPNAFHAYTYGLLYGARYTTDGRVPAVALIPRDRNAADELVKAGLWEVADSGWYAPKWHEHYPSAAELVEAREAARARQRRRRGQE